MKPYKNARDILDPNILSRLTRYKTQGVDRVLKSTRLEDTIYNDLRSEPDITMEELEAKGLERLSTFKGLSRDVFQAMYSLNPRRNEESELSTLARKFNRYIIDDMMNGETYPTLKSLCEGRELPAFEASREFVESISEHLDELLQAADGRHDAEPNDRRNGKKGHLGVLEKLEAQQEQLAREVSELAEQLQRSGKNPALEQKLTETANKAESKARQVAALNQMVDDNLRKNKPKIQAVIQTAAQAAQEKAQETHDILLSWGTGAGDPMGRTPLNQELLAKVRESEKLLQISKFLGRFREIFSNLRKNSYAFGRGEKYALEMGNDLGRVIASEFAMLATPETVPLFLKKYQRKTLKQYQRREAICKGYGDIIVCLDESGSTAGEPAAWGKAMAFALLEAAKVNKRNFALIHFSGKNSFKTDLFPGGKYSFEDAVSSAETFLDGGTDYQTPLTEALRLIREDGFQNADVVFITDGECEVSETFAESFGVAKTAHRFTVTGLLLDKGAPGFAFSLEPFCERIYRTSEIAGDEIAAGILSGRV